MPFRVSESDFSGPVVGAAQHAAAAAVVEEGVHGLLEHPLLVAHDDVGRAQLDELLQAVVAVDDPAVEVVQVRGREAAAVQGDQGPQVGRDDRDHVQDHPLRLVAALAEGLEDPQALGVAELALLGVIRFHQLAQAVGILLDVDLFQEDFDGLGADRRLELVAVFLPGLALYSSSVRSCFSLSGVSAGSMTTYDSK